VVGNSIATVVVAKWEGEYDPTHEHEPMDDPEPVAAAAPAE
jgi:Na+/H+-dicarboxylate symporter